MASLEPPQSSKDHPIQEFRDVLADCTVQTPSPPLSCGRSYVRMKKLLKWWEEEVVMEHGTTTQATRLLDHVYREWHTRRHSTPKKKDLFSTDKPCIVIFSILLDIGHGDILHHFIDRDKHDKILPFESENTIKDYLKAVKRKGVDHESVAAMFYKSQWKFCPVEFDRKDFRWIRNEQILPIHNLTVISKKGGTANLWQIEVLKEFVSDALQAAVVTSEYTPVDDPQNLGPRYHFALKVFKSEWGKETYTTEREAFHALRGHDGMVQFLCSYQHEADWVTTDSIDHGTRESVSPYHILLEYGDRDLDDVFSLDEPPVLSDEIENFWHNLFGVADALRNIHNLLVENDGLSKLYYGWHADIKPANILEIEGKYKLADLGFAGFVERSATDLNSNLNMTLKGGTSTFQAPEFHPSWTGDGQIDQAIDIWALGCVFSIAATWIALGQQGIAQYKALRLSSIKQLMKERSEREDSKPNSGTLYPSFSFHDGLNVLQNVLEWHSFLRDALKGTDHITSRVLDIVDGFMLVGSPTARDNATVLCEKLSDIRQNNHSKLTLKYQSVIKFLRDEDAKIPDTREASTPVSHTLPPHSKFGERQLLKSKIQDEPLRPVTHRSQRNPTSGSRSIFKGQGIDDTLSTWRSNTSNSHQGTLLPADRKQTTDPILTHSRKLSQMRSLQTAPEKSRPIPHFRRDVETIQQARVSMEKKRKSSRLSFSIFRSKDKKDQFLAQYYHNRDIVFLVDNAESMAEHWSSVQDVLEVLLMKVSGLDDDGVDLIFTRGSLEARNAKGSSKIMSKITSAKAHPTPGVHTDIVKSLNHIFDDFKEKANNSTRQHLHPKEITILVLTDGSWRATPDKSRVENAIIAFIRYLKRIYSQDADRLVGIQFLRFGNDPKAISLLTRLDEEIPEIAHIVDTEPALTGDVDKMLIGSFVYDYDNRPSTGEQPEDSEVVASPDTYEVTTPDSKRQSVSSLGSSLHPRGTLTPPLSEQLPRRHTVKHEKGDKEQEQLGSLSRTLSQKLFKKS